MFGLTDFNYQVHLFLKFTEGCLSDGSKDVLINIFQHNIKLCFPKKFPCNKYKTENHFSNCNITQYGTLFNCWWCRDQLHIIWRPQAPHCSYISYVTVTTASTNILPDLEEFLFFIVFFIYKTTFKRLHLWTNKNLFPS